ncbi:MAG: helix-turn-helix domain-containing protein [Dehalococcoidia bacterium]
MTDVKRPLRDRAAATRSRILHAAHEEFARRGYHGATIASIAKRAGVATQTVYFVFHTKAALISALIDMLVMGEDQPVIPQDTEWWAAMRSHPDPRESLRHFIRGAAPLFERASETSEILRAAALTDDEVRQTHEFHEGLREAGFREVIEVVATKGTLRRGLDLDSATDVLLTVYGDSTYHLLRSERGWSHEQTVEWFCDALPALLFEP